MITCEIFFYIVFELRLDKQNADKLYRMEKEWIIKLQCNIIGRQTHGSAPTYTVIYSMW